MNAILSGPFIDDFEFRTRLGIDRPQLREVLASWPTLDADENVKVCLAINNCLNETLRGVYVGPKDWADWFTASKEDLAAVYLRWSNLKGYHATSIR